MLQYEILIRAKKGSGARMKPSGVGGMAVIEGVMMKNKDEYAVAIRKPNNEIVVEKDTYKSFADKVSLFKLPIFRGMLAFVDSMVLGIKILNVSANYLEEDEVGKDLVEKSTENVADQHIKILEAQDVSESDMKKARDTSSEKKESSNTLLMAGAVIVSIIISVSLFMVTPVLISSIFTNIITNKFLFLLFEGIVRISIFILYVLFASQMPEIKRVFMYHGAEHKTINCIEHGLDLTVENVRGQSKQHKRCGTSFMFLVMFISLIFFIFMPKMDMVMRILSRVFLVPVIAGVSYEFIRLAGKSESKLVDIISKPGMWVQNITTKEPDDTMIEVAIQSVEAVFDWKSFVGTSTTKSKESQKVEKKMDTMKENAKATISASKEEIAATTVFSSNQLAQEEEEDEILKALDKYFVFGENNSKDVK